MIDELMKKNEAQAKNYFCKNQYFSFEDNSEHTERKVLSYTRFETEKEPVGTIIVSHAKLFGEDNFKSISNVSLPDEINEFFKNNPYLFNLQFPVFSSYVEHDWLSFSAEIMHPDRMARVMVNKWDYICESYHRRGFYSFKKDRMIPVVYMGEGGYLTYYYGKKKAKGIYYFDEKIADTYVEMIKRLSIHPTYYLPIESRIGRDNYKYKNFDKNSAIPRGLFRE